MNCKHAVKAMLKIEVNHPPLHVSLTPFPTKHKNSQLIMRHNFLQRLFELERGVKFKRMFLLYAQRRSSKYYFSVEFQTTSPSRMRFV